MATDIMDKDLKELRNGRWEKAFSDTLSAVGLEEADDNIDRKATIVIEHLIQVSRSLLFVTKYCALKSSLTYIKLVSL